MQLYEAELQREKAVPELHPARNTRFCDVQQPKFWQVVAVEAPLVAALLLGLFTGLDIIVFAIAASVSVLSILMHLVQMLARLEDQPAVDKVFIY